MLIAHYFSIPYEKMNAGLAQVKLTNMRMELVEGRQGEKIINDAYNASPTSMMAAIELVSNLQGYKRRILVLGDMLELGPEEEQYHLQVGTGLNPEKIDFLFTYGELGAHIATGAIQALGSDKVFAYKDKLKLIEHLKKFVDESTLVLVKASRGMRLEEVVQSLQKK
jgi:UDP-N-acetylmuramoyl-tripeptide--D-alanyl-D-alanine ligase